MTSAYLIGICGTAMATLAAMLKAKGYEVRGSDANIYPPMDRFLSDQGITPLLGYDKKHITEDIDLVVVGNAVSRGNPEVEAVLDKRLRYASFPEVLRDMFLWDKHPIVVAGTHGKTTTTSMIAWALVECEKDPSFLIGGIPENFSSSFRLGQGDAFVVEGDEYDSAYFDKTAKCLKYLPQVAIVGNVEFDHADIYQNLDQVRQVFERFVSTVPRNGVVLLGADNVGARSLGTLPLCRVETFGLGERSDWRATELAYGDRETRFSVRYGGRVVAEVTMPLLGAFNVRNAVGAIAALSAVGVSPESAGKTLGSFQGVRRRLELRGIERGVSVYDDFAHHPTAVGETLNALRQVTGEGCLWAVFEPRSATSCRKIFQESFAKALAVADKVILAPVYRTQLPETERLSVSELVEDLQTSGTPAESAQSIESIRELIVAGAKEDDVVVFMSNGGFSGIHEVVLGDLRELGR